MFGLEVSKPCVGTGAVTLPPDTPKEEMVLIQGPEGSDSRLSTQTH